LTQKIINYHEDDYKKIMAEKISFRSEGDIEAFTIRNLEILDNLKG